MGKKPHTKLLHQPYSYLQVIEFELLSNLKRNNWMQAVLFCQDFK